MNVIIGTENSLSFLLLKYSRAGSVGAALYKEEQMLG